MKRIAITQRVVVEASHGERRDCLDQRWAEAFDEGDAVLMPVPNGLNDVVAWATVLAIDGIMFSGGNTLAHLTSGNDAAPERDRTEIRLLDWARANTRPVFGVCRGMQSINDFLGGRVSPGHGHAGTSHAIRVGDRNGRLQVVNSYHDWVIPGDGLAVGLRAEAWDEAGCVEAFRHDVLPWAAVMWHPERDGLGYGLDTAMKLFGLEGARR